MPHDYSEDQLIEQNCIEIFQSLKYGYANCYEEKFDALSTFVVHAICFYPN